MNEMNETTYVQLLNEIQGLQPDEQSPRPLFKQRFQQEQRILSQIHCMHGEHLLAACKNKYAVNILDHMLTLPEISEKHLTWI